MKLSDIKKTEGARKESYRKGRGYGSGNGKTGGRGHKGQKARSGGGVRPGFEGGQVPFYMRMPMVGFNNKRFAKVFSEVKLYDLERAFNDNDVVNAETLIAKNVIKKENDGVVILGNGTLTKKLTVQAAKVTKGALTKIEAAGGKVETAGGKAEVV